MASSLDPFARLDPFTLQAGGLFEGRLQTAVDAARAVLDGRSVADVKAIAEAVSAINDEAVLDLVEDDPSALNARRDFPDASEEEIASLVDDYATMNPALLRDDLGELAVFLTAEPELCRSDVSDGGIAFERAEALATLALWLAADCIEESTGWPRLDPPARTNYPEGHPQRGSPPQDTYASVLALDAMRASTLAEQAVGQECAMRALIANGAGHPVVEQLRSAEQERRKRAKESAAKANEARHGRDAQYIEMAIALATSREFEFRIDAAEHAANNIERHGAKKKYFSIATVDAWLKDRNWRAPGIVDPPDGRRPGAAPRR